MFFSEPEAFDEKYLVSFATVLVGKDGVQDLKPKNVFKKSA
jgi:hypothetical protein